MVVALGVGKGGEEGVCCIVQHVREWFINVHAFNLQVKSEVP